MGAQVLEETVTDNETKVAAKASTVLVEKRDGRVVDLTPSTSSLRSSLLSAT